MKDVVIIGGGFSGLYTAFLLERKGLSTTVLERTSRVGGKTRTQTIDDVVCELGTCGMSVDYRAIFDLARELDLPLSTRRPDSSAGENAAASEIYAGPGRVFRSMVRVGPALLRYVFLRKRLLKRFAEGDPAAIEALALPANDFLRRNGLGALAFLFSGAGDVYGYGPTKTVPALYLLNFITPWLIYSGAFKRIFVIKEGFEAVLGALSTRLDVRLNCEVTSTAFDAARGAWRLQTTGGALSARHVVVACDPHGPVLDLVPDEERRRLLRDCLDATDYTAVLARVTHWFQDARRVFATEYEEDGKLLVAMNTAIERAKPAELYTLYTVTYDRDAWDEAGIVEKLKNDVADDGGCWVETIEVRRHPYYNRRFTSEALRQGAWHAVRDAQGRSNVWLVNPCLAQENWRNLASLANDVATGIADAHSEQAPGDLALAAV